MKINFKSVSERLSDKEMKLVTGGDDPTNGEIDTGVGVCFICWKSMNHCVSGSASNSETCFNWGMANCPIGFACGNCGSVKTCLEYPW